MKPRSCAASADTCKTLIGNVTVINAVCARDCYLVDLWSMRFLRQASAWSEDRLHLTSDSHRRVALRGWADTARAIAGVLTLVCHRAPGVAR